MSDTAENAVAALRVIAQALIQGVIGAHKDLTTAQADLTEVLYRAFATGREKRETAA